MIYVIKNLLVLSFALLSRIENISVISKDAKRQQVCEGGHQPLSSLLTSALTSNKTRRQTRRGNEKNPRVTT